MKFSIVIPTQDRPNLLAVVVKHAMQVDHPDFEVIVSDNSTSEESKQSNLKALGAYLEKPNFHVINPQRVLPIPEHFEFALDAATGDYVTYLTDKMVILPGLLSKVEKILQKTGADIVNWAYAPYAIDDIDNPGGSGTLTEDIEFINEPPDIYDPLEALRFKAECEVPRNQQGTRDYALGKIVFGCYSKELIHRIRSKTGMLFGGATHDYSAMIQALSLAGTCVMLNTYGVIFISLPRDKSLGSLTATDSQRALFYFQTFTDSESIIANLLVPGLYASQHNMVSYDYKKFLPLYGHMDMFNTSNWLRAISDDLHSKGRIWGSPEEKIAQLDLMSNCLRKTKIIPASRKLKSKTLMLEKLRHKRDQVLQLIYPIHSDSPMPARFSNQKLKHIDDAVQRMRLNKSGRMLIVYSASQTYTATVFEYLDAFRKYSENEIKYINIDKFNAGAVDFVSFNAVLVHYSVRLPFGQLSQLAIKALQRYVGLKVLFIQDEYNDTNMSKQIIGAVCFDLVFSVVPENSLEKIYPQSEFPATKFVSCFTGYVPDGLDRQVGLGVKPSTRQLTVAYRGRSLPVWYGKLGQEKIEIGQRVKEYCQRYGISCDIAWDESARIYGEDWYKFISSTRAMLGSESGSNVFDWNGSLQRDIQQYRQNNPASTDSEVYREVVKEKEIDGLMNQISPRIFEMAAAHTVMVLLEGEYSGVLKPHIHYVPLKKDFSNLKEVFETISDDRTVDAMAERTYTDLILSGRYGYRQFVEMVDGEVHSAFKWLGIDLPAGIISSPQPEIGVTSVPSRAKPPLPVVFSGRARFLGQVAIAVWQKVPIRTRPYIKRLLGRS